jgi:hypothetical protein
MRKIFLLVCAVGLVPIALGYGAVPGVTMERLFGITVDEVNLTHIFRAVMGLYLAMAMFWLLGAFRPDLARPALMSCAIFMFGLAAGRALSLVVDGMPHPLLVFYLGLEILFGVVAIRLLSAEKID